MLKRTLLFLTAAIFVFAISSVSFAQAEDAQPAEEAETVETVESPDQETAEAGSEERSGVFNLEAGLGANMTKVNEDETKVKVGEYDSLEERTFPNIFLMFEGVTADDGITFEGKGVFHDLDDQDYEGKVDLYRYITQEVSYSKFKHWLDHDPLTNLYGASSTEEVGVNGLEVVPPLVTYTDADPGTEYGITRSEVRSNTEINIPWLPFDLKTYFNFRREDRKGHAQSRAISKCGSCHVTGMQSRVNEYTQDLKPGLSAQYLGESVRLSANYEYLHREFTDKATAPEIVYDNSAHPTNEHENFDDRLQYDRDDGLLEFDKQPDSTKDTHSGKINVYLPSFETGVLVSGALTTAENTDQELEFEQKSLFARLTTSIVPDLFLNAHYRYVDLENKSVFVDTIEPVAEHGDNAGYTWYEHNPASEVDYDEWIPDYTRYSAMSKTQNEMGVTGTYFFTRWLSLKGGYTTKTTTRENYYQEVFKDDSYQYYSIPEETVEDTIKAGVTTKFRLFDSRPWRTALDVKYKTIDTPFSNIDAAYVEDDDEGAIAGGPHLGTQYWELHDARNVTLTNQPAKETEGKINTRIPVSDSLSANLSFRYTKKQNEDSQDWEDSSFMPTASILVMPMENMHINLSYAYLQSRTSTLLVLPVFDG